MFTSLVALSSTFILFQNTWLTWIGKFLVIQDSLEPGDVIHVIAGDIHRTDYAFQMYWEGYAKKIFFTGGWCETHLYGHGARAREKALAQGVPLDVIASDDSAVMSTYMEAERLKDWIAKNSSPPIKSIIVVSDPFHMRRARWTYQRVFGEQIQIQMAPVPFDRTPYQLNWWRSAGSREYVEEEYFKFVFYLFRYEYSWGVFRDWLASFDMH